VPIFQQARHFHYLIQKEKHEMQKAKIAVLLFGVLFMTVSVSHAQFSVGADVVSRYLWRGWDYGNSAAVQPAIAFSAPAGNGSIEIGAWGNFSLTDGSANENDLYVSYSNGPFSVLFTDYTFPAFSGDDNFFKLGDDGAHILELGGTVGNEIVSGSAYYAFSAPAGVEKSWYFEGAVTPPYEVEDIELSAFISAGNGFYDYVSDGEDTKLVLVSLGLTVTRGIFFGTYAINPDQETSFLVFGISL
jgi:hypothetical protein